MGKNTEPRICVLAPVNEVIALNVAIARHLAGYADEQDTNQLLRQFQHRLTEQLDALSIPHPSVRGSQHG